MRGKPPGTTNEQRPQQLSNESGSRLRQSTSPGDRGCMSRRLGWVAPFWAVVLRVLVAPDRGHRCPAVVARSWTLAYVGRCVLSDLLRGRVRDPRSYRPFSHDTLAARPQYYSFDIAVFFGNGRYSRVRYSS